MKITKVSRHSEIAYFQFEGSIQAKLLLPFDLYPPDSWHMYLRQGALDVQLGALEGSSQCCYLMGTMSSICSGSERNSSYYYFMNISLSKSGGAIQRTNKCQWPIIVNNIYLSLTFEEHIFYILNLNIKTGPGQMSSTFSAESQFISYLTKIHQELDNRSINHILNQQLFYHAQQQLPNHIPNEHTPPTTHQLANRILRQLPGSPDYDQLLEQLQHRLKVLENDEEDQLSQLRAKWGQERQKIKRSGARVKDYHDIYEQEIHNGFSLHDGLTKRALSYFQTSTKDRTLDEMLTDLMTSLSPEERPSTPPQYINEDEVEEEARVACDDLLEQLKLIETMFNFQQ